MKKNPLNNRIDIVSLNKRVHQSPKEIIQLSESNYFMQLDEIAKKIAQNHTASILLLAGPSASSKTTTSNKLREGLNVHGIHSVVISLDDFYIDRHNLPLLSDGSVDYETIETLDLEKLYECFGELLEKKECDFPLFDFSTGCRSDKTKHVTIDEHSVLIIEGLHALNPRIINGYDKSNFLKVYISPNSDYCIGNEVILSAREVRLIRRIIRDHFHRASPLPNTLSMWVNVIAAEVHSIFPFREQADFIIDSTVIYEPCVYVDYLTELIRDSKNLSGEFAEQISDLKESIEHFASIDISYVPKNTVLREFLD